MRIEKGREKGYNDIHNIGRMPGLFAVNNKFVNLYLFKSGDQYIVFDAGGDEKATLSALDGFGIDARDVAAVFLTHTDYDHVVAVPLFPTAEIYMAESNGAFLSEKAGRDRSKAFLDMDKEYKTLNDSETTTVAGVEIKCIYTPGHTAGSACYLVNGNYLFTGDNLKLKDGKAVLFNDVFNMDNDTQKQSLRKLSELSGVEAMFTMHTGFTTDFKAAFVEWAEEN